MMLSFLLLLIAVSGHVLGYVIGRAAREELKPGRSLLEALQLLVLLVMVIFFVASQFDPLLVVLGIIAGLVFRKVYAYFGLGLSSVFGSMNLAFGLTTLIFVYGLPAGSIAYGAKRKKMLGWNVLWFVLGSMLGFVGITFISFVAGALLSCLVMEGKHVIPGWFRVGKRRRSDAARL